MEKALLVVTRILIKMVARERSFLELQGSAPLNDTAKEAVAKQLAERKEDIALLEEVEGDLNKG